MPDTLDRNVGTQIHAVLVDEFNRKDGATRGTNHISPLDEHGQFTNRLAPGGAVSGDGSAGAKIQSQLTGQNILTNDFTIEGGLETPASNPTVVRGLFSLSSSASNGTQANSVVGFVDTTNTFRARIHGATPSAYNEISLSLTPWAGEGLRLGLTRVGASVVPYVNGLAQTPATVDSLPYTGTKYLALQNTNNNYITTPDAAANTITGDITLDVHVKGALPASAWTAISKFTTVGTRAYALHFASSGTLQLFISTDGTANTASQGNIPGGAPVTDGWFRVTRRQSDGVTRYFYSTNGTAWTQFDTDKIAAAGTAIFAASTNVRLGNRENNGFARGDLFLARGYDGFEGAGTKKFEFNANDATDSTSPVTSAATGEVWTLQISGAGDTPAQLVVESTTWARSVTSTWFNVGFLASATSWVGALWQWKFGNFAATPAELFEIFKRGGLSPERYKFGSILQNTATIVKGQGAGVLNSASAAAFNITGVVYCDTRPSRPSTRGSVWKISGTVNTSPAAVAGHEMAINVGSATGAPVGMAVSATGIGVVSGANVTIQSGLTGAFGALFTRTSEGAGYSLTCFEILSSHAGDTWDLSGIVVQQLGFVVILPMDDGLGFQLQNLAAPTNAIGHALMTTTGFAHVVPGYGPARIRYVTDGTTTPQKICGGTTLPANSQLLRIRARAQSGTPNIIIGVASGGSTVVASVALSTSWKDLTIALTGGIVASATDLWTTVSTANPVEIDHSWEPLSS